MSPSVALGLRSRWNFVPRALRRRRQSSFASYEEDGCEVGVHGLRHDGRTSPRAGSPSQAAARDARAAERWGAVGFRSPGDPPAVGADAAARVRLRLVLPRHRAVRATSRRLLHLLPFFNGEMVELPMTLPQDHTLFALLGCGDGELWQEKVRHIRKHGGMALVLTHPDYASNPALADAYPGADLLGAPGSDAVARPAARRRGMVAAAGRVIPAREPRRMADHRTGLQHGPRAARTRPGSSPSGPHRDRLIWSAVHRLGAVSSGQRRRARRSGGGPLRGAAARRLGRSPAASQRAKASTMAATRPVPHDVGAGQLREVHVLDVGEDVPDDVQAGPRRWAGRPR